MLWMQFKLNIDGKIETSKNYSTSINKDYKNTYGIFLLTYFTYYTELKWKYTEQCSSQTYKL